MKKISAISWGSRVVMGLMVCSLPVQAAMSDKGGMPLAVSGGIAQPSFSTSVFQNPAGIVHTPGFNLNGQGGWDTSFGNGVYSGAALWGNGTVGLEGGITHSSSASSTSAFFGAAGEISSIKTTFGLSGSTGVSSSGGLNLNAGIMIDPGNKLRFGFTAFGLNSSINELGAGLAFEVAQGASIVIDGTANTALNILNFKPGLMVSNQNVGLTASYGFGNGGSTQIISGFSAGGFVAIGQKVSWEIYYNQISPVFTSLAIHL